MRASPLYTEESGKLDAESVQKREADTQRTQACHLVVICFVSLLWCFVLALSRNWKT